jgi:hypothetical protein
VPGKVVIECIQLLSSVEALKPSPFFTNVSGNAMSDVGLLNKNSAVFKSVIVEIAGMKNAKFTQEFFMNIKNNGQDIASNISHAIESSWRSVF